MLVQVYVRPIVIFVEWIYDPFLVNFVKAPQPEVQGAMDAR